MRFLIVVLVALGIAPALAVIGFTFVSVSGSEAVVAAVAPKLVPHDKDYKHELQVSVLGMRLGFAPRVVRPCLVSAILLAASVLLYVAGMVMFFRVAR